MERTEPTAHSVDSKAYEIPQGLVIFLSAFYLALFAAVGWTIGIFLGTKELWAMIGTVIGAIIIAVLYLMARAENRP